MTRPDWCPEDVWEAACAESDKTSGASEGTIRKIAARAILAERERCAKAAGNYLMLKTPLDVPRIVECEEAIRAGTPCQ